MAAPEATSPSRPAPSRRRKLVFAGIACGAAWLLAEVVLGVAGVPTLGEREDPFRGFSRQVPVFEADGEELRVARAHVPGTFNAQRFRRVKPPGALRLFCLGGSSAYGYPWGANAAFTAILGDALADGGRTVEAINLGGVSYASHRLRILTHEVLAHEPDLLVVYSGHNEFVERGVFERLRAQAGALRGLARRLSGSRVSGLLHGLLRRRRALGRDELRARVQRDESRRFSPAEQDQAVADFAENLAAIVDLATARGVRVVLCTVPCNLADWAPNQSRRPELSAEDAGRWNELLGQGRAALHAGDAAGALGPLETAARLAPAHAHTRYALGSAYLRLGKASQADRELRAACDLDASPTRRLNGINQAVRRLAARRPGETLLVDVDTAFAAASARGVVGFQLIEDYVHPTQEGHRLIAWLVWQALADAGWLGADASSPDRTRLEALAEPRQAQGLTGSTWLFNQGYLFEHRGLLERAIALYRQTLEVSPTHPGALGNLAHLLTNVGRPDEALPYAERLVAADPANPEGHLTLANALAHLGELAEAEGHYRDALARAPERVNALVNLALLRLRRDDPDEAADLFERVLAQDPRHRAALLELGAIHERAGRLDAAHVRYAAALAAHPRDATAHCRMGRLLGTRGERTQAREHLETARALWEGPFEPGTELGDALRAFGAE